MFKTNKRKQNATHHKKTLAKAKEQIQKRNKQLKLTKTTIKTTNNIRTTQTQQQKTQKHTIGKTLKTKTTIG